MYFQPENNHESSKKLQVQIQVENYFSFQFSTLNRGDWNVKEKRWGKQSYLATSREDIREAYTILAYCFTGSLFKHKVVHRRFFQFWLTLPNRNFKSRSIEYNFK